MIADPAPFLSLTCRRPLPARAPARTRSPSPTPGQGKVVREPPPAAICSTTCPHGLSVAKSPQKKSPCRIAARAPNL